MLTRSNIVLRCLVASLAGFALIGYLPAATFTPVHVQTRLAANPGWLDRLNTWRATSGLSGVTENATWSQGDAAHALYMVKNDLVTHYETPGVPYYTAAGDTAARDSNIFVSSTTSTTDQDAIDWWMGAPFHSMGLMDPRLTSSGFGSYREVKSGWDMGAAVDVLRGNNFTGGSYPVYFPGNGSTEPLSSYSGNEFPDPLQACANYSMPTGLPLYVEVGGNVATSAAADSFTGNGVAIDHCVIDSHNAALGSYLTTRGAALVIPRQPLQAGVNYVVKLTVNGTPYTWSFNVGPFNLVDPQACTSTNVSAATATPTVTFTATSTGCPTSEYKWFLETPGGSWTAVTSYGPASWAWSTAGLAPGVYGVGVWARHVGSLPSYQSYWLGTYTLPVTACNAATISTATTSPQAPGTMVPFTAAATRCPGAQFRFWLLPKGGAWTVQQDYGANSWTWNTTGLAPGTYELGVWARQPGSTNSYDAYGFTTFELGAGNCRSAELSPNTATPQAPGATVGFTASSNTCASPLYQFWVLPPGGTWTVEQKYSALATWSWNTTGWPLGTYQVGVWAKASGSGASYDAYFIGTYQLDVGTCTSASISASPASPQAPGATVTFTAVSTGCSGAIYQFWKLPPGGSWSVAQPYAPGTTLSWNTTGLAPGPYRIGVWARQTGSANGYDTYAILTFWVGS